MNLHGLLALGAVAVLAELSRDIAKVAEDIAVPVNNFDDTVTGHAVCLSGVHRGGLGSGAVLGGSTRGLEVAAVCAFRGR